MDYGGMKNKLFEHNGQELLGVLPCGVSCAHYIAGREPGTEELNMVYTNEAFFECIGYKQEEFEATGRDIGAIVVRADREAARQQIRDAISREGEIILQDYQIHRPDNSVNHVFCSMRSVPGFEEHHFVVGVYMKIDQFVEKEQIFLEQQAKMEEITSRLNRMIQELPSGCAVVRGGENWELVSGNEEFFHPFGYTLSEIQNMPNDIYDVIYREDIRKLRRASEEALRSRDSRECELRIFDRDGRTRWIAVKIRFYYYKSRKPHYLVSCWDIHERKLVEEELHLQTERYKLMEEINNEFPFEYDVKKGTMLIPRKFSILLQKAAKADYNASREEMEALICPEDAGEFREMIEQASRQEEEGSIEYRMNIARDGEEPEYAWFRTIYKSIRGVSGKIVRILGRTEDISGEKLREDEMTRRLNRDPLTGVLNKAATKAEIEEFLQAEPGGCHALFLIDVDNFKTINDTFGHLFGDSVLANISEKIKGLFRSSDVVGRIGGDEFLAFMKHASESQAEIKAQSICDAVRQEYNRIQEKVGISCSVGIALVGNEREDYATLFSRADMAMYQAKESGKNRYRVAETVDPEWKIQRKRGSEKRNGQYLAGQNQDTDFLTSAFSLLSHAKDVNNSLNLLIERIGRKYNLGMAGVIVCSREKREVTQTNCWTRRRGILENAQFTAEYESWNEFKAVFDSRGMAYINDCQAQEGLRKRDKELFQKAGINAMVICSFSYFERGEGFAVFCNLEKKREWSDFEKETFLELSRLISVFVALRVQQEEDQKAIRRLKKRDPLTGLYNEETFMTKVKKVMEEWKEEYQYAVVYMDIKDFSYINDNFGHSAGNEVLRRLAAMLEKQENSISCRLYSDLFITFIWDRDKDTIIQTIAKNSQDFSRQQKKKYVMANVKTATGIYFIEDKEERLEIAIENANLTRKSIKGTSGVFCRVYEKRLRQQRETEKQVVAEFQKTLEEGRLKVHIQPKFSLKKFTICGGEALARWETRAGEIEYPGTFIPALEKSGYIINLDFYICETVLGLLKKWKEQGKELPVISINFSRKHFEGDGIYQRITELTRDYGIEPGYLEIEITESLFAMGYDLVKQEMQQLRNAGFKVAIDDFGTGYSSLSMLLDIPADTVKIDKSFLLRKNRKDEKQFIRIMGELIHSAKEEVVFEGVETEEQAEFLKECGFEVGQGFLFDRPLPVSVFEEKYMK